MHADAGAPGCPVSCSAIPIQSSRELEQTPRRPSRNVSFSLWRWRRRAADDSRPAHAIGERVDVLPHTSMDRPALHSGPATSGGSSRLAPWRCARFRFSRTIPGRSGPMRVTISGVVGDASAASATTTGRRIIGARVAITRILRMRRQRAVIARMADDAGEQGQTHRRQRPFPELAAPIRPADQAPVLRRDRACVPAVSEVIDRAAGDRVAFENRPLTAAMPRWARQQREW